MKQRYCDVCGWIISNEFFEDEWIKLIGYKGGETYLEADICSKCIHKLIDLWGDGKLTNRPVAERGDDE